MLEKELKYELSKENYLKLIRSLKKNPPQRSKPELAHTLKLTNYYFDDSDLRLRKRKFALRIRIVDKKLVYFTLKYPAKMPRRVPRALKVRVEHEVRIPMKVALNLLKKNKKITDVNAIPVRILQRNFSKDSLSNVHPLGRIETKRTVVPLTKTFELEIDHFQMFGNHFYEVEVETHQPKKIDKAIKELFETYDIPYLPLTRSKFGRFIEEWKRRRDR